MARFGPAHMGGVLFASALKMINEIQESAIDACRRRLPSIGLRTASRLGGVEREARFFGEIVPSSHLLPSFDIQLGCVCSARLSIPPLTTLA